jgi:hypothetical protein
MLYTLICREMDIQSSFSFKFWVLYWSMEIKGENVRVDLQLTWSKGPSPPPNALIGGSFLNWRAVSPAAMPIREGTRIKIHSRKRWTPNIRGSDPLRRAAMRYTTLDRRHPFFLDAGAASVSHSTSSPTVCDSRSLYSRHVALDQSRIPFKFIPARSGT